MTLTVSDSLFSDDPPYAGSLDLVLTAVLVKVKQTMIMLSLDPSVTTEGRCPQQRVKVKVDPTKKNKIDLDLDL